MKIQTIRPVYVEFMPKKLEDGVLYISKRFATASHNCCCGCGTRIVTPLRETEYSISEVKGKISVRPSIGNWNFPCQSHYWIEQNEVIGARQWGQWEIEKGRESDEKEKDSYFGDGVKTKSPQNLFERCRAFFVRLKNRWR